MVEAEFVQHEPCPACGSSDNLGRYSDGHGYCFTDGCGHYEPADDAGSPVAQPRKKRPKDLLPTGKLSPIPARKLRQDTIEKFGYHLTNYQGQIVQVADYRGQDGIIIAQHLRFKNKEFAWIGSPRDCQLWSQHLWRSEGKMVVVTEGEIDAMSVAQVTGLKWPVVSVPSGSKSAAKAIGNNSAWLEGFDRVVLCFDMDEPGQSAAHACIPLLSPGKVRIAHLPLKDASDMLVAGRQDELINALWSAQEHRPDGIIEVADILEDLFEKPAPGRPWPWEGLTQATLGRRDGEIYGFGAGVGVGKTDVLTQCIAHDIANQPEPVGVIYLEQPVRETVQRIAGKRHGQLYHVDDGDWTEADYRAAVLELSESRKLYLYNHFGRKDWSVIEGVIRYFAGGLGIKHVYLDHLTALTARADDERRCLDRIMEEMASVAQELGIVIHFVSHLTTPDGTPHEEGGRVYEKHFTGSRAIARWAHALFGLERDKQAEDPDERRTTTVRVLKERWTGRGTGTTIDLRYDPDTGILHEVDANPFTAPTETSRHDDTETCPF